MSRGVADLEGVVDHMRVHVSSLTGGLDAYAHAQTDRCIAAATISRHHPHSSSHKLEHPNTQVLAALATLLHTIRTLHQLRVF